MGRSADYAAFLRCKCAPIFLGIDEPVALFGSHVAHAADGLIDRSAAVRRQLFELLKYLPRLLLLVLGQVLPGFHSVEHALLLLRRQAGKILQALQQSGLLLRRKPTELRIIFQRVPLLCGRQIFITAQPVPGVPRLVLWRMGFIRTAGTGTTFFLKVMPLPVRMLRSRMLLRRRRHIPGLGEQGR